MDYPKISLPTLSTYPKSKHNRTGSKSKKLYMGVSKNEDVNFETRFDLNRFPLCFQGVGRRIRFNSQNP